MAARHYAQILDASDPDQSADDVFTIATAPPEVLRGSFDLYYRPKEDSSYVGTRCLLSVQLLVDELAFVLEPAEVDSRVSVIVNSTLHAVIGPVTFDALQELKLRFNGVDGTITLTGATTGDGVNEDGIPWNVLGSELRLGGSVLGGNVARGYVSLPYAVPGATLPDPYVAQPSQLDFSEPDNSGLLSLF